ncbi:hypothetical protein ABK040_010255 [Willaertia magna]
MSHGAIADRIKAYKTNSLSSATGITYSESQYFAPTPKSKVLPISPSTYIVDLRNSESDLHGIDRASSFSSGVATEEILMPEKSPTLRYLKTCCPAINSLQNILLFIFLFQTFICIGAMVLLFWASGERVMEDIARMRSNNLGLAVMEYLGTAPRILNHLNENFIFVNRRLYGRPLFDDEYQLLQTLVSSKHSFSSCSSISYGNSKGQFMAYENTTTSVILKLIGNNTAGVFFHNEYYEPKTLVTTSSFNVTTRPWYTAGLKSKGSVSWTPIFTAVSGILSLAACTTVTVPNNKSIVEVIGVHFDLNYLNYKIGQLDISDMYTKSIYIIVVERNGNIIINTSPNIVINNLSNNTARVNLANCVEPYSQIAYYLNSRGILSLNSSKPYDTTQTRGIEVFNGKRLSYLTLSDGYGLDWVLLSISEEYSYANTVFYSSPAILSCSIVLIILSTLVMVFVTQVITRSIWKVSKDLYNISRLEIDEVKTSKLLNGMYELKLLQNTTTSVKNGFQSFIKFIPKEIVRDILRSGIQVKLGMTSCNTSIIFTDVVDFTTFSESSSTRILLKVITEYFNSVSSAVEENGGVIDKFIGDGVMAIFSHTLDILPDHAEKACRAALLMTHNIDMLKELCIQERLPHIQIRVGVNTGTALIGNIGSKERFNFTAIGDTVNTSSRLEALNKRYGTRILIGSRTFDIVSSKFLCYFVDCVKLKGKLKITDVHTLQCELSAASNERKYVSQVLTDIKELLRSRKFREMKEKCENLASFVANNLEDGMIELNLIKELKSRAESLIDVENDGEVDFSLTVNEK